MTQNEIIENAIYGVMLTSGQAVRIVEVESRRESVRLCQEKYRL